MSVAIALVLLVGVGGFLFRRSHDVRSDHDITAAELAKPVSTTTTEPSTTRAPPPPPPPPTMTLAFGGDVQLRDRALDVYKASPLRLLSAVRPLLARPDFSMVNLNTAISDGGVPIAGKALTQRAPEGLLKLLQGEGIDAVTMANRHGLDDGRTALIEAINAARRTNLPVLGAGLNDGQAFAPYRAIVNGHRLAVLAATQVFDPGFEASSKARPDTGSDANGLSPTAPSSTGMAYTEPSGKLVSAVRRARQTSDVVVVYVTWGGDTAICPNPAQKRLADELVDAGADVVIGSGAHRLQGTGHLTRPSRRAYVSFGLGDLVSSNRYLDTSTGGILELTMTGRDVTAARLRRVQAVGGWAVPLDRAPTRRSARAAAQLRRCAGLTR